jgi:hypothetical protein
MSRGLEARLVKLEKGRMSPQARVARMSDEALAAECEVYLPHFVAHLLKGSAEQQAFALTLQGRRSRELTPCEQHQILAILQAQLSAKDETALHEPTRG